MLLAVAYVFGEFPKTFASILRTSARCLVEQQYVFELGQLLEAWHSRLTLFLRVGVDGTILPLGRKNSPALEVRWMGAPSVSVAPSCRCLSSVHNQRDRWEADMDAYTTGSQKRFV